MYNDTIKVANKIISYDDLLEIFSKMQEKLVDYQKISNIEGARNRVLDYNYQNWTFKDIGSKLSFDVDFYDDTHIKFDNYNNFITVFNNRLEEIKSFNLYFSLAYETKVEGQRSEYYTQHINMWIYENKIEIYVSLSSNDDKMSDIYELIKKKISNAPPKYDEVIKNKNSITATVTLAIGFIPALIITTLLIFVPTIREIYSSSYVLYPIISVFLALVIGGTIGSAKLEKCYKTITPEQKYAGYDSNKGKSIYKDDIDKYVATSEILIGKNVNNLTYRKEIKEYKEKYKKWIPYEIGIMILISIIVLFF